MAPSILVLDIETAPDVVWTWGVYQANAISVKEHWYVLSFAAKWVGQSKVIVRGLCDYPDYDPSENDDSQLLRELWDLLERADVVVAHNGASFDVRKLNARFIDLGFDPPPPYKVIDTKRDLKRVAWFSSNKLDWLSKQFKLGEKIPTDFSLWEGCMTGKKDAWKKMLEYNKHDVVLTEKLYHKIAPWIDQPNANIFTKGDRCPNMACGSTHLVKRGIYAAKTRTYQRYLCADCGTWSRSTNSVGAAKVVRTCS